MSELSEILDEQAVRTVFQSIVRLSDGRPLGFEALSRGPEGSPLESPLELFGAARAEGRLADLDRVCRVTAVRSALALGMTTPTTLFFNVEPDALGDDALDLDELERASAAGLRVVIEFTERALVDDPARLLATAARVRELGWAVALDDVGANPHSLALLPVLSPDVVKLDLSLVQQRPDSQIAAVANAVNAYAERTGASILAEGIETDEHLHTARALGASLGQGWRYARPVAAPEQDREVDELPFPRELIEDGTQTPFKIASAARSARPASRALLLAYSDHLELQALNLPEHPILLACFQEGHHITRRVAGTYQRLAGRLPFVACLGQGVPREPVVGVHGTDLAPDDPLVEEWTVLVLGPHFAGALVAHQHDPTSDIYDFVLTYDRPLVARLARSLVSRLEPRAAASVASG